MKEFKDKAEIKQKRGLYFALAVCLVAIAVAAIATYGSIMDYVSESNRTDLSGQVASATRDDPETVVNTVPKEEESTAEPEVSEEPTEEPSADEEQVTEEKVEETAEETDEVNANVEYTPSDSLRFPVNSTDPMTPYSGGKLIYSETMKDYRTHNGTDLATSGGETVFASGNGKVARIYKDLLLGNIIEIEHGDYTIRYCGFGDTLLVGEGETVEKNQAIGSVFEIPAEKVIAAHIHIEVMQSGEYVNPMDVFAAQ